MPFVGFVVVIQRFVGKDTVARWQNVIRGVWISAIPIRRMAAAVSYTHLTLPTNREV